MPLPLVGFLLKNLKLDLGIWIEVDYRAVGKSDFDGALRTGCDDIALCEDVANVEGFCRCGITSLMYGNCTAKVQNLGIGEWRCLSCAGKNRQNPRRERMIFS